MTSPRPPEPPAPDLGQQIGRLVLASFSLWFVLVYAGVAALRLAYPYDLEWLEGGTADHVARVLAGAPLYAEPSLSFTAFIYPPLYYWAAAAVAKVVGPGFLPLRLVSVAASIACMAVVFAFVRRETDDRLAALAAVGLFAATYPLTGAWIDTGRIDTLFLLGVLVGAYGLRGAGTPRAEAAAGAVFALAFFTKQVALVVALPLCVYTLLAGRGAGRLAFTVGLAAGMGGGTLVANAVSDGWFGYYVFGAPAAHFDPAIAGQAETFWRMLTRFWTDDLLGFPIAAGLAALALIAIARTDDRRTVLYFLALSAGMIGASWSQRLHLGGHHNNLIPAFTLLAMLAGIALARVPGALPDALAPRREHVSTGLLLVGALQLALLFYDPRGVLPTDADRRASGDLVRTMATTRGEILSPARGYLPTLAGKAPSAHLIAVYDVIRAGGPVATAFRQEIESAVAAQRYDAVFTPLAEFNDIFEAHYVRLAIAPPGPEVTFPRGSAIGRVPIVLLPRRDAPARRAP